MSRNIAGNTVRQLAILRSQLCLRKDVAALYVCAPWLGLSHRPRHKLQATNIL